MRGAFPIALLATVAALAPARVSASPSDDDRAQMLANEGMRLYGEKRYAEALEEFKRGYDLSKRIGFLYNLGMTQQQLGDFTEAREYFKTFLFKAGPGDQALVEKARARLTEVESEINRRAATKSTAPAAVPSTATPATGTNEIAATRPAPRPLYATWVSAALTVATLGTAIGLDGSAWSGYESLKGSCAPLCSTSQIGSLPDQKSASIALFSVAAVAAVVTVVAAILEVRARHHLP
jgi:tetratricopeptide (TPR) repeat protein